MSYLRQHKGSTRGPILFSIKIDKQKLELETKQNEMEISVIQRNQMKKINVEFLNHFQQLTPHSFLFIILLIRFDIYIFRSIDFCCVVLLILFILKERRSNLSWPHLNTKHLLIIISFLKLCVFLYLNCNTSIRIIAPVIKVSTSQ